MNRKEANMEIIRHFVNYINMYPDQRFCQMLENLEVIQQWETGDLVDSYYEESEKTLNRIKDKLRRV